MTHANQASPDSTVQRPLVDGYVDDWLIAGPYAEGQNQRMPDFDTHAPCEGGLVFEAQEEKQTGSPPFWQIMHTDAGHRLMLDAAYANAGAGEVVLAWLAARVEMEEGGAGSLRLILSRPAQLWLNGERVGTWETGEIEREGSALGVLAVEADVQWRAGENELRVCTRATAGSDGWIVSAQLMSVAAGTQVILPTAFVPVERREHLAAIMDEAFLTQDVYQAKERIWVEWPHTTQRMDNLTVRLQAPNRRIYAEGYIEAGAGKKVPVAWPERVADGRYDVVLSARPDEYFEKGMRVVRRMPVQIVRNEASTGFYGTWQARAQEGLEDAASRKGLFAQIARLALGRWQPLDDKAVEDALARIEAREGGWRLQLTGILGLALRFGGESKFPAAWRVSIRDAARAFLATLPTGVTREDDLLLDACAVVLAGQLLEDESNRQRGTEQALAWLTQRGQRGFGLWHASAASTRMVMALSHLTDLAQDEELVEMAAVVLDKLLFTVGINSFQGVAGSAQAESSPAALVGSGADPFAGVGRIAWGKGTFNAHLAGTVSLACATSYVLPEIIAATAVDVGSTFVQQERHDGRWGEAHVMTYRSPAGIVSAALDYRAGEAGHGEHVWQATLGPGVVLFANHPATGADGLDGYPLEEAGTGNGLGAGFWRGNVRMPRVGQVDDLVLAWYRVDGDDAPGFTHAYFPRTRFDEYRIGEQWAFGRKGTAYVALYTSGRLTPTLVGAGAHRELRADVAPNRQDGGHDVLWLCRIGSETTDGTFENFCSAAARARIRPDFQSGQGSVAIEDLWGRDLSFGWAGPLLVADRDEEGNPGEAVAQPLRFENHYAGEFCRADFPADALEIDYKGHAMRLEFGGIGDERA